MTRQTLSLGTAANDGTGDTLRDGGDKINDNFAELYFHGARAKFSADQTAQDFTAGASIQWNAEDFDTDAIHDLVTNKQRMTVPAGFAYARIECGVYLQNFTGTVPNLQLRKNGTAIVGNVSHNPGTTWAGMVSSGMVAISAADYFDCFLQVTGDASVDIFAARSFMSIQLFA